MQLSRKRRIWGLKKKKFGLQLNLPNTIRVSYFEPGENYDGEPYSTYTWTYGGGGYMGGLTSTREYIEFTYVEDRSGGSLTVVLGAIFGIFNSIWSAAAFCAGLMRPKSDDDEANDTATKGKHQAVPMENMDTEEQNIDSPPAADEIEDPQEDAKDDSPLLENNQDQQDVDLAPAPEDAEEDKENGDEKDTDSPSVADEDPESVPAVTEENDDAPADPDEGEMEI